jgi:alpha-ketoglutarate-dependent taurine dioxygenase
MPDPDRTPGLRVTPRPAATTTAAVRRALRRIVGLDRAESRELLSIAHDQYRKPEFQVRFSWRPGSVAFWDNRAAVHYAVHNYGDFPPAGADTDRRRTAVRRPVTGDGAGWTFS